MDRRPDWKNPKKTEIENDYLSASRIEVTISAERVTKEIFEEMTKAYPELSDLPDKAIWERYVTKVMAGGVRNSVYLEEFLLREDIKRVFHYHMMFSCLTGRDFVNLWQIYDLPNVEFPWSRINVIWSSRDEDDRMKWLGKISEQDLGFMVKLITVSLDRGIASDQVEQEEDISYAYDAVIRSLLSYAKLTGEQEKALCGVYKFSHEKRGSEYPGHMIGYKYLISHKHIPFRRKIPMDEELRNIILDIPSDKLRERTLIEYASCATTGLMFSGERLEDEEGFKLFSEFLWSMIEFVQQNDLEYTFDYVLLDMFKYLDEQQWLKLLQEHVLRRGIIDVSIDDKDCEREKKWRGKVAFLEVHSEENVQGIRYFGSSFSDKLLEMIEEAIAVDKEEKEENIREKLEERRRRDEMNENDVSEMKIQP